MRTLRKLCELLNPREQRQAVLLLALMLALGLFEVAGVGSIFPLIAVLSDPLMIESNHHLKMVYDGLGFQTSNGFLIFLSVVVFLIIVARTGLMALTTYGTLRYAQMRAHTISVKLLGSYLRRPYSFFLNRHSADMGKSVLSEVEQVVNGSMIPVLRIISRTIISAFIVALLLAVEPVMTLVAIFVLGAGYGAVFWIFRGFLQRKGKERVVANRTRFQVAQEVLGGVKEVKIGGLERGYLHRFEKASLRFARLRTQLSLLSEVPRYLLELVTLGGILILVMVLLFRADGQISNTLPVLGLFAFASLRLTPALQIIYKAVVAIRFGGPALDALYADFIEAEHTVDLTPVTALPLTREIALRNVSFSYPKSDRVALHDISLTIPVHSTIGFVGATGAGKSTVVDLILGLLEPQQGSLLVDGVPITSENARAWQRSIGYVPQQIFLADESMAANIAFGMMPGEIDRDAVERAARMANLHDFIAEELPEGYDTEIGDRGVRLSGGQRQRLAIARALYHDPQVIVFDEATSALDNVTERLVMESIRGISRHKTIIIIAHRISTVQESDNIVLMDKGRIIKSGKYEELYNNVEEFRKLALA